MMGLARPPNRTHAETTTPPVLQTLAAAVDPIVGSMVKADDGRSETLEGFQICRFAPEFQGAFWLGRVRLLSRRA
jgi:hypothetical protein